MKNVLIILALTLSSTSFAEMPTTASATVAAQKAAASVDQAAAKADTAKDAGKAKVAAGKKSAEGMMVNVNTASKEDIAKLPGIGPKKAQAIIDGRPYTKADDLKKVKGIKDATLAKIKDKLSF